MSTQTATVTSDIELTSRRANVNVNVNVSNDAETEDWRTTTLPADPNNFEDASRLLDNAVPDGGYGWIIVASCSLLCFWFVGTTYSWGVIQAALIDEKVAAPSTLAFVGSVAIACNAAFAIPNAKLLTAIGARRLAMLGLVLMGGGQILSGFTERNIGGLFVTAGFMMGYGVSACYMCCSVLTSQYFFRKRGLANGIVFAGGGLGGAVISLSMSAIVERLGTAWAFRLIGFLMLGTGLPVAYFIKERVPPSKMGLVSWSLIKEWNFLMVFLAGGIATFPLCVPVFFLPLYARSLGYSAYTGAALVSGFNFASAIGRIICGFAGDKIGALNSLFFTLMLNALSMLCLWPVSTSLAPLIAFVAINGMGNGGFFAIMPTVVSNVFGSARVANVMGTVVSSWTFGYFLGAPIAGYILEAYGGEAAGFKAYRPAIFYAGSMGLAAAGVVWFLKMRISKNPLKKV